MPLLIPLILSISGKSPGSPSLVGISLFCLGCEDGKVRGVNLGGWLDMRPWISLIGVSLFCLGCEDGKIRGVNLGGWLVMEPWITPKIFEAVSVGDLLDVIKVGVGNI